MGGIPPRQGEASLHLACGVLQHNAPPYHVCMRSFVSASVALLCPRNRYFSLLGASHHLLPRTSRCAVRDPIATMPTRKRSYSEEAERLQQRSLAMTRKAQIVWVGEVLKTQPELVSSVITHLRTCGVTKQPPGSKGLAPKEETRPAAATTSATLAQPVGPPTEASADEFPQQSSAASTADDPNAEDSSEATSAYIPRKYATWEEVPVIYLIELLSALEPASLSRAALKALIPSGKKAVRREPLLEIFEYILGLDRAAPIAPSQRNMPVVVKVFAESNVLRGRLGRDLILPVDWRTSGLNRIEIATKFRGLIITNKFQDEPAYIPVDDESIALDAFSIEFNFSDSRAVLTHPTLAVRTMCAVLFAGKVGMPSFSSPAAIRKKTESKDESPTASALGVGEGGTGVKEEEAETTKPTRQSKKRQRTDQSNIQPPKPPGAKGRSKK